MEEFGETEPEGPEPQDDTAPQPSSPPQEVAESQPDRLELAFAEWAQEFEVSLSAAGLLAGSQAIEDQQRNMSLVEVARPSSSGVDVQTRLVLVHWIWSRRSALGTAGYVGNRIGREVAIREGKVVYTTDLLHNAQRFEHDRILLGDVGVRMEKVKFSERPAVPQNVLRLKR
eukprot:8375075-Heterocapsa_arctica.AAC.1